MHDGPGPVLSFWRDGCLCIFVICHLFLPATGYRDDRHFCRRTTVHAMPRHYHHHVLPAAVHHLRHQLFYVVHLTVHYVQHEVMHSVDWKRTAILSGIYTVISIHTYRYLQQYTCADCKALSIQATMTIAGNSSVLLSSTGLLFCGIFMLEPPCTRLPLPLLVEL